MRGVIVTGGSQGIGRAIAERFLEDGAAVVICSRRRSGSAPTAAGREAAWIEADVRDVAQIDRVVAFALERLGRIDVLVNNAGGSPPADAASASPRFSTAIVTLNLLAPLWFAQRARAAMTGGGVIINVASVSGLRASPGAAAYGAAKAGLINLTQSLAVEWGPAIRVNAVSPGLVLTEAAAAHATPGARAVDALAVADACVFLASPAARNVSGANLVVDGANDLAR
jgi:NAD(P)-dependent dehydrogenase (short-subunit alcohol dehydrogenase family)